MTSSGGCEALSLSAVQHSMPLPNIDLRSLVSGNNKPENISSIVAASIAAATTAKVAFDFWGEEENTRFIRALDSERYPPDYNVIAAKVGNRTAEQCTSYTQLYFEALAHKRRTEEAAGRQAGLHLTAKEVYSYHGVGPFYDEFTASKENVEGKEGSAGKEERTSVSFMCNDDVGLAMQKEKNQAQSAVVSGVPQAQRAQARDGSQQNLEDDKGKERGGKGDKEGSGGKRSNGAGAVTKRKREQEKPMEQVNQEIDRRIVRHEDLWAYSAMKEGEPEGDSNGRRNKGKNPWLWSKKVICKITGYQQWWPLFSDYVHLTEREAKDDLKVIRAKAPPPTVSELCNPYSRKFDKNVAAAAAASKKQKVGAAEEAGGKPVVKGKIQVGEFVEVKWGVDWWHAQVIKLGKTSRANKLLVGYVGGTEDEEEWVEISRVRTPQEDVRQVLAGKGGMR